MVPNRTPFTVESTRAANAAGNAVAASAIFPKSLLEYIQALHASLSKEAHAEMVHIRNRGLGGHCGRSNVPQSTGSLDWVRHPACRRLHPSRLYRSHNRFL